MKYIHAMQLPFNSTSERLHVISLGPKPGAIGHDARGRYVEKYWLSVLGPSATWLLRHIADELESSPTGFVMNLDECAQRIGLTAGKHHSPFSRALRRLVKFELARYPQPTVFAVQTVLPSLAPRHVAKLPSNLRAQHAHWLQRESARERNEVPSSG
jgi:hypothetical protein